ncbi:MAG: hypothetical protein PF447_14370 [Spirochaetaceae bacterium]|jgi:hypothetical protein|nr:hypothetical protein [Spirochaetaceae bacterium]
MKSMEMKLSHEKIAVLESVDSGPCLSLYQETHRTSPDNIQDPIRFRNLVKGLKESLKEKYPEAKQGAFFKDLDSLANNPEFWAHNLDGLAVLVGAGQFHVFRLQRTVSELAVVENVFFLRPLRRYLQSVDRFQILGLGSQELQLFEGNRNSLDKIIAEPEVPITITAALGEELAEIETSQSSHSGLGPGTIPSHYGYSDKQNEIDIDTEKYFRAVDKAVLRHHSNPSALPLILACLPEHQQLFHRISNNPFLQEDGLGINPEALSLKDLKERAWKFMEPKYLKKMTILAEDFIAAKAKGLGSDDIALITKAAADGRVETLLLEADRLDEEESVKGIEDLSELVGKMGGLVQIIPAEHMPGKTGVVASYRY